MSQFGRDGKNSISHDHGSFTPRRLTHKLKKQRNKQLLSRNRNKAIIYSTLSLCMLYILATLKQADGNWFKKKEPVQSTSINSIEKYVPDPIIEEDESDFSKDDHHFTVRNVKECNVELHAVRGECTLFFDNQGEKKMIFRTGDKKIIQGKQVWFRLGKPSNVDIFVNNKLVTTRAQDQEKSYFFTRK